MNTVMIPKQITKGEELVVIPRKLYQDILHAIQKRSTAYSKLPKNLRQALDDVDHGRIVGPFSTLEEGLGKLKQAG